MKDSFSAEKAINKLVKFFPSLGPPSDSEGKKQAKEKEIEKRLNKAQEAGDIAAFMRYADTVGLDENLEPKEQPIVNEPTDKVNASEEPMEVEPSKRQPIVEVTPTGSDPVDNLAKKTSNVVPSALKGFEGLVEFKSKETCFGKNIKFFKTGIPFMCKKWREICRRERENFKYKQKMMSTNVVTAK